MNRLIIIILGVFSTLNLSAQGPPITTETPIMLGLEGNGIRTFGKFISKENVNTYIQVVGIPYNISTKFQIGGIFPFRYINPKNGDAISGFADITIFAKYQMYKIDGKAKTFRILGIIKQTFPTGRTSSTPPIGSGLSHTYIGLILGKISSRAGFYTDFGYTITNKGATDNFSYNFSVGLPLLEQKYPQKQLNTFLEFNGNYLLDPNINTVFISPGLQFIPGRRLLVETSFQLPVLQQNIKANKTNYMLLVGIRFLIN